ncbi:MAG: 30S ribosomal protein S4 [bacterium]
MFEYNKCKKCRRAGEKLFLKGERCFGQKCAMIRRPYIPGIHGKARRRQLSEYGRQLAEKQKVRHAYGISEKQLKNYFKEINEQRGNKGELLLSKLEQRLDNIIFRLGWASSRRLARQLISHGHILVNGRKVNIPSYQMCKGNTIQIKERSKELNHFKNIETLIKKYESPSWLLLDKDKLEGKMVDYPKADETIQVGEMGMIIEYYSR